MDRSEVVVLLTLASTYDYRKVGDADVEAWWLALDDIALDDGKLAVVRHYRESPDRLMPAHVRAGVKVIREERQRLQPSPARQLPSRFETDRDRAERAQVGSERVRDVLTVLAQRMQDRGEHVPGEALERLREITTGPVWAAQIGDGK